MRWAAITLLLASCTAPPADGALACGSNAAHRCPSGFSCIGGRCYAAGHVFDMAVQLPPEDMAAGDLAAAVDLSAADLAQPAGDLGGVTHFYPQLEQQVEARCISCHASGNPAPRLISADTAQAQANYQQLKPLTDGLVTKIQQTSHCMSSCVPAGDIEAWQRWVSDPQP
jgi:hypothetical protein